LIYVFLKGILPQHILNNISQTSAASTTTTTIPSSLYSSSGSNSNIPLDSSSSIDPAILSQQSSLLTRTISENDRSTIISNGSSDGHSLIDNTFSNIPSSSTSSSFLSNNNPTNIGDIPSTNGGVISQLASSIPINPDHHSFRYMLSSNILQQQPVPTGRVPLTQAEMRMLNRLNSAYAKLPSLLESERQRYLNKNKKRIIFCFFYESILISEQMRIVFMVEVYLVNPKLFHIILKLHQRVVIRRNFIIDLHRIHYSLYFIIWRLLKSNEIISHIYKEIIF
jgi:hypothetical protein